MNSSVTKKKFKIKVKFNVSIFDKSEKLNAKVKMG